MKRLLGFDIFIILLNLEDFLFKTSFNLKKSSNNQGQTIKTCPVAELLYQFFHLK